MLSFRFNRSTIAALAFAVLALPGCAVGADARASHRQLGAIPLQLTI